MVRPVIATPSPVIYQPGSDLRGHQFCRDLINDGAATFTNAGYNNNQQPVTTTVASRPTYYHQSYTLDMKG